MGFCANYKSVKFCEESIKCEIESLHTISNSNKNYLSRLNKLNWKIGEFLLFYFSIWHGAIFGDKYITKRSKTKY